MDIELARTFLELVRTRSFVRAAENLNISQTAVSARIRSLEDQIGRTLFLRNKNGTVLSPAGEQFLRFAPMFVQLWERARQQVAVPKGRRSVLAIGGETSLSQPWLLDFLHWMRREAPDIALRVQVGMADNLAAQVSAGVLDLAVMYAPQQMPGARVELLMEEKLVLVTTHMGGEDFATDDYAYVDWGADFARHHGLGFPDGIASGFVINHGPLALNYILEAGGSGYFRQRAVAPLIARGRLRQIAGAPIFFHPVYAVCSAHTDEELIELALAGLRSIKAEDPLGPPRDVLIAPPG
ncbi:MAG TPA: LysR family transcriptional regulator [Xanthobacteraceae bacterium]|nr:LysR family transcriptional regulator [Xanthobacteraceae bacterium]